MAKNSDKIKYVLYALELTEENIKAVQDKRFYRITPGYILLYERYQRTTNYNAIGDSELSYLSYADKRWLLDCNFAIIAEETEKHKEEIAAQMGLMLDRLEEALKEEQNAGQSGTEHRTEKS